jgi:Diacylglycerol kinase catalytic domain
MGDDETAHPARRPVLFVNPTSGEGRAVHAGVPERARERGIDVIILRPDHSLATLVRQAVARGADALGVAGGDGSLAVVATAAQANGLPFVCIPAGTRNHFALDLGVDRHDPIGALDAFTDGRERRIDVAQVNERLSSTTSRSESTAKRSVSPPTGMPSCARCCRPQRRRSVPAGRRQNCTSSTTWGGSTTTPRSCWSPTIPTPWARHRHPAPAQHSTAAGSGSSSSTHRVRQDERGARPPSRSPPPGLYTQESMARPSIYARRSNS